MVHERRERGVGIKTLSDPILIDTSDSSAMAEVAVELLALFAHMELVFGRERAAHARSVAEAKGKLAGRPRKLSDEALAAARASVGAGMSVDEVAPLFGVSRATLYRHLNTAPVLSDSDETVSP